MLRCLHRSILDRLVLGAYNVRHENQMSLALYTLFTGSPLHLRGHEIARRSARVISFNLHFLSASLSFTMTKRHSLLFAFFVKKNNQEVQRHLHKILRSNIIAPYCIIIVKSDVIIRRNSGEENIKQVYLKFRFIFVISRRNCNFLQTIYITKF